MKTRSGFISNSSSQSFVIRGFETNEKALALELGIDLEKVEDGLWYTINQTLQGRMPKKTKTYGAGSLQVQSTRMFFDGEETGTVIVGEELVDLDDGCVCQLPEPDDESIRIRLENILGRKVTDKFFTFVQYISNDNY